jgi:hypothetical protein
VKTLDDVMLKDYIYFITWIVGKQIVKPALPPLVIPPVKLNLPVLQPQEHVGGSELESLTSAMSTQCSNQLS